MSTAPAQETWTVMRLLQTSAKYLAEKNSSTPRLDAELLLAETLKTTRLKLYVEFDKPVLDAERSAYRELIKRRAAGEPVAYIMGTKEFYGRSYKVDKRVLVPRPETELLIDAACRLHAKDKPWRIADFGTGSGALAITLALEFPASQVVAVDLSADALTVARENAVTLGAADRMEFVQGSWAAPVAGRTFDWVVSNPPYIADNDPDVQPGVKAFEPHVALFGGREGLDGVQTLAEELPAVLAPGGTWLCEFGEDQSAGIAKIMAATGWDVQFEKDLSGTPRIFVARRR
jgi:release factor glutamine methyltransferase